MTKRQTSEIAAPSIEWGVWEWLGVAGAVALAAPYAAAIGAYGYAVAWLFGMVG